ncbi:uncharacterized protein N7477_008166 [Penicillium maclennaniae]|uniref:uncharacterized protein n=1 Tax=Penicillium maclennaniae TaxID=1343394 RepID=UPI0025423B8B|nr:uncharacterized protein N7477_008166 [Penicillium maclennaniae]KAJ5665718.1 hypothetical protein N7477_008166 [Penicillium maclennaniae]
MFFNKSSLALAFVALGSIVSAHQTPACVLSVMGSHLHVHKQHSAVPEQQLTNLSSDTNNPADLATICGTDAKKTETAICNSCGSGAEAALKYFANVCTAAGHEVDIPSVTASSATASSSGFATAVSTSGSKATGSTSGSGSGSGSESESGSSSSSGSGSGSSTGSGASRSSSASTALHTGAAVSDRQLSGTTLLGAAVFAGIAAWL